MTDTEIPSVMRALVVQKDRTVVVEERPVPKLDTNDILIKVEAIAQNPTDWKHVNYVTRAPGTILGCDFSGTVVQMANGCRGNVSIGDHVVGFTHGGYFDDQGAFAQYAKTDSDLVWVVPANTLSYYETSTMGCALWTAAQGREYLSSWACAPLTYCPRNIGSLSPKSVCAHSAAFKGGGRDLASVGQYAIQLAHAAGYKIATVASPHNHALVKSLGADVVFDYKSPNVISEVKDATDDKVSAAFDTISRNGSQSVCVHIIGPGGGKVVTVNPIEEAAAKIRENVELIFTMIYTALGRAFTLERHYPVSPEDRRHMADFLRKFPQLVKDGHVRPNKNRLWEGGLYGVKDGLKFMMEGGVSAEKIVYRP